jgi:aspartate 1-decarboxylase
VIKAPAGSKTAGLNGGAAMLGKPGDRILVISYAIMDETEAQIFKPTILFFDEDNNITD